MNASLAILAASTRSDGWKVISDSYPEILTLIHSPFPNVQQRTLLVAVHEGIQDPRNTVLALEPYIAHGTASSAASTAAVGNDSAVAERAIRSSAVQELLRLEPGKAAAHDAIDRLLSEDLSTNDRLTVIQSLADENPASERTLAILLSALEDLSPVIREGAIRSLERLSGERNEVLERASLKLLQMSSNDPEPRVRAVANEALNHPPGTRAPLRIGARD